ncbi:pyruvate dehydrogenase E2 component (dihydrolipoamide acetyltransferase) [Acinetobacter marinus]|uniref:Dihydrolipoamide acetyltransferase component of pyruvate dehydrogenase complex n=1 Tax=Acinetobacter marinus TaxID=281375 RepID=A0A1G6MW33_9GAMM|nr:2-oxo acid dehydrogenase subunit E2 [Acinetobacter marinus]SDC59808.1 pyruvate dehydrogenase E2 component (dihydrolipoamide acetyltransferase) [Acinetobacter marinus]
MQIITPDIGVDQAQVTEILVKVGDQIAENDSILVLESDKASVEVPSTASGTVKSISVNVGDTVKEGTLLIELEAGESSQANEQSDAKAEATPETEAPSTDDAKVEEEPAKDAPQAEAPSESREIQLKVPDIGVEKASVAEVLVKVGDVIAEDDSIIVVESDKATVEVPSTASGEVLSIAVKAGDMVKEGVLMLTVKSTSGAGAQSGESATTTKAQQPSEEKAQTTSAEKPQAESAPAASSSTEQSTSTTKLTDAEIEANAKVYAGPAVRQMARQLGVVLSQVKATGSNDRILKEDVYAYVKGRLNTSSPSAGTAGVAQTSGLPKLPSFDAYGGAEVKAMTRLQQVSVPQLSLNNFIPQVTQFDLADITALEAWRNELKADFKKRGTSLTILAFIAKAVAHLLKQEPYFAGHLADDQKSVLLRNEIHMGIAVATEDGLTVPVLRNPDLKSIAQIATELAELSQKARDKKLAPKDLQGANFTITSLGSIGGTAFTPLVNWPQVAILGISPATMQPVWDGQQFQPKLMLPLSLSYDHRVINGADAARFTNKLTKLLQDIRSILL